MVAQGKAEAGRATSPALVMLHGFALDSRMWRPQVEAFADDYRVLTVDLPGFGPQARELGEVVAAASLERALDAAKIESAHILGNSFGAAVAADFALRSPARVRSLSLMGPTLVGALGSAESWARCVSFAEEGDRVTAAEVWLDDPLFEGVRVDDELFEEIRHIVLDYGGAHFTGKIIPSWTYPEPLVALRTLEVPSLIVSGENDLPAYMQMAEQYAQALPRSRREIVRGAGHLPNVEQPEAFNALLEAFLMSL